MFDFLKEADKFSEKASRTFFQQIIRGLKHLHQNKFSHRDLKAENLIIGKDYHLKISDARLCCVLPKIDGMGMAP